jgi:parallel beta-helix repeat protein
MPFLGAVQTSTSFARRLFPPQFDPYPLIREVSITGNTIRDSAAYGIVLGNADGGQVVGNTIERPFSMSGALDCRDLDRVFDSKDHALEKPADPKARPGGIFIFGSRNIAVKVNTVLPAADKGGLPPLVLGPWNENVGSGGKK